MSDKLNEKFEEFATEQKVIVENAADPMPTVTATVIPGTGSEPSQVSDAQTSNGGGKDPMPTVGAEKSYGQSAPADLGGTSTTPNGDDVDGADNPGAKAAAPVGDKAAQGDGSAQTSNINDAGDQGTQPTVGADAAYGTSSGSQVTYPIKPSYEDLDVSDDVNALLEGTELSKEFAEKAKTIFEAAVVSKLNEELDRMHEDYAKALETEIETVKTELAEKVDDYLSYAVTQWMDKNSLQVEAGIKAELGESVLTGLKKVFVENYIELPDEKVDLVDDLQSQLNKMESKLNESIEENVGLSKKVGGYIKNGIVTEIAEGLSLSQKEKLISLAEAVEFVDEETFRTKVSTLRESYFSTKPEATETVTEDVQVEGQSDNPSMSAYVDAIARWKGK